MNIKLIDKKARGKIAKELDKNLFVEAGAGSGKTYSLVDRMVNLIKSGTASIENIAAVTFTRKAAAELSEKFQIKLEECLKQEIDNVSKDNILKALSNLEQAFIGTIHSFCSRILRERPVEAETDPGFIEIEEDEDLFYAERVWSSYIEEVAAKGDDRLNFLQGLDIRPADLINTYLEFVRYPEVKIEKDNVKKPNFNKTKEKIAKLIKYFEKVMPEDKPEKGWDKLQEIINKSKNYINSRYFDSDRKFMLLLNELNKKPKITQNRWPDGNSKEHLAKMESFQEEVVSPALKSWQEYLHKPLADFISEGVKYYRKWRKEHSILNFGDLLTDTAKLLRENLEVRKYFKKRFTHILVDEFQDTDPLQAEIILFLTGSDKTEKDWRKIIPEPGSLFLVGDPKQSIYRFRRADIDIYNLVKKIFIDSGGEVLELHSNFRSLPFMQELVDEVFGKIFPENETKYQAKFFPLKTVRNLNTSCLSGIFENSIGKVERNNPAKIAKIDAAKIANWIKSIVSGNTVIQDDNGNPIHPKYSDFLILTRYKKNLSVYGRALELLGIPYNISGGESFNQSVEINELFRLFRAVEDENDPVALITTLRGMFFGISDDRIYRFKKAGGIFSYYTTPPEGFTELEKAFDMLKHFKMIINSCEPWAAANKIVEKLGIIPFSICKDEGLTRAGSIYKALELLKDRNNEGINTFSDFVGDFKELLESSEIESISLTSSNESSVRIMNLHKAKGLEAPVVILADPMSAGGDFEPGLHIERTKKEGIALGYFMISKPSGSYSSTTLAIPPRWDEKAKEEKLYDVAEDKRLEYVAITRAKNILVVSTYRYGSKKKAWEFIYNYLNDKDSIEAKHKIDSNEREGLDVSVSTWKNIKDKIGKNLKYTIKPSYGLTNVTIEAKEGLIFSEAAGLGMSWGRIVHKAIELVSRGGYHKLKMLAKNWIEKEGRDKEDLKKLITLVDNFMRGSLWNRIKSSKQKYFEVPFALKENKKIVYGVIDLVFKEEDGWVIVDYKTDDFEKDKDRKKSYEKQIDMYKKYWEKISEENVKEIELFKL